MVWFSNGRASAMAIDLTIQNRTFLSRFHMVSDKMVAICPDFRFLSKFGPFGQPELINMIGVPILTMSMLDAMLNATTIGIWLYFQLVPTSHKGCRYKMA